MSKELKFKKLINVIINEALNVLNESSFHEHKDWIMYEGQDKITVIFRNNNRLCLEVGYPGDKWGEEKDKWKHKAASRWKSLAREIYNDTHLSEGGNLITKNWEQCYQEALKHPDLQEYMPKKINLFDKNKKAKPQEKVIDPVNFTSFS